MPLTIKELLTFVATSASLAEHEVSVLCDRARRPDYWASICPHATIGGARTSQKQVGTQSNAVDAALENYAAYGHCGVREAFATEYVAQLKAAVDSVAANGWPLVFAFVYDEFWSISASTPLHKFVSAIVGEAYQPTISFWVNNVAASRGNSGFPPHFDDVRPGHHAVTCWIPLTEATTENGCIYVVERDPELKGATRLSLGAMTMQDVPKMLLRVRALPASPGSFLAWPNDTLHWGGGYLCGSPRTAISFHLTASDYENVDHELTRSLVPTDPLPPFENRVRWVARALLRFRVRDPFLERFAPVARILAAD